jgi:hypothetical protein
MCSTIALNWYDSVYFWHSGFWLEQGIGVDLYYIGKDDLTTVAALAPVPTDRGIARVWKRDLRLFGRVTGLHHRHGLVLCFRTLSVSFSFQCTRRVHSLGIVLALGAGKALPQWRPVPS